MKREMIAVALMALTITTYAQTEKKLPLTQKTELSYAIAADGKTKDGLVTIKDRSKDKLWVQGRYTNNERTGTWYFFNDKDALIMRYSYDQKKVLFLDPTVLKNVNVKVLAEDTNVAKEATTPLPLVPLNLYLTMLANNISKKYTDPAYVSSTSEITAHVDTDGKATYTVTFIDDDKKRTEPLEVALPADFTIDWVPSIYKDKKYASEFTLYAKISSKNGEDDTFRRFDWSKE